jgi:hypothetical protein
MLKRAPTGELDKFGRAAAKVAKMTQFSLTSFKFTKQAFKARDNSVFAIESETSLSQQLQPSKPSSMLPNSCHGMFADYNKRGHFKDNLAAYMMYAKSKDTSNYVCNYVDGDDFPQIFSRGCERKNGEIQSPPGELSIHVPPATD